jgi:hypothetical protein
MQFPFIKSSSPLTTQQCCDVVNYCFLQKGNTMLREIKDYIKRNEWESVAELAIKLNNVNSLRLCLKCNTVSSDPVCCGAEFINISSSVGSGCKIGRKRLINTLTIYYDEAVEFMKNPIDLKMFMVKLDSVSMIIIDHFTSIDNRDDKSFYEIIQTAIVALNIYKGKKPRRRCRNRNSTSYDLMIDRVNDHAIEQFNERLDTDQKSSLHQHWSNKLTSESECEFDIDTSSMFIRRKDNYPSLDKLLTLLWIQINSSDAVINPIMLSNITFLIKKNDSPDITKQRLIGLFPTLVNMLITKHLMSPERDSDIEIVRCDTNNQYWIIDGKDSYHTINHSLAKRMVKDYPYLVKLIDHPLENFCNTGLTLKPTRGLLPGLALSVYIYEHIMKHLKTKLHYDTRFVDDLRIYTKVPNSLLYVKNTYKSYGLEINYDKLNIINVKTYYIDNFCKKLIIVLANDYNLTRDDIQAINAIFS